MQCYNHQGSCLASRQFFSLYRLVLSALCLGDCDCLPRLIIAFALAVWLCLESLAAVSLRSRRSRIASVWSLVLAGVCLHAWVAWRLGLVRRARARVYVSGFDESISESETTRDGEGGDSL